MGEILNFSKSDDFRKLAAEKIDAELKEFKGDRYGQAVKEFVAATLKNFSEQSPRFAEVVYKTKRTLSDCCASIMKGCGQHISDIDVYRAAVKYYFPNSDVCFVMNIDLTGDPPTEEEMAKEAPAEQQPKGKASPRKTAPDVADADKPPVTTRNEKAVPVKDPAKKPSKSPKSNESDEDMIQLMLF